MSLSRSLLFCLLLLPLSAVSQSRVSSFIRALDSLTLVSFDDWRMSPDLRAYRPDGDPTRPGFDDSQWALLKLNENVYPDSCWLRKTITLPRSIFGRPLSGRVTFHVSVDDYGYLWVNGVPHGHFPWDGDFELTPSAQPGQTFVLAIKAVNTGGPLRLIRAEMRAEATERIRQTVEDLKLSLQVGEKLLSFDTYQTNAGVRTDPGTDRSAVPKDERLSLNALLQESVSLIDLTAVAAGPEKAFNISLGRWRSRVKPVSDFAKRFTLHFTSNAHIDAAWLWRERETIEVCNNTFRSANNIMDARPDATYAQSSAAFYKWMEEIYPDTFTKIKRRVQEGRWEVTGGMWVEPDCNLPSGDSWMRHLLYAKRYFKEKLGVDVALGWNPDSFGYNASMPMLYQAAGIDAFITQKIGWNDTNVFPHRIFWWRSPDGSRILSVFPFDYVNEVKNAYGLVDWMRQFEANTGFRRLLILFGIGNHGGGPSMDMMRRIDRLATLEIYPAVTFGTAGQYVSWLRAQNLSDLPVWDDELYLEYHRGTYTTQAAMKQFNREGETLLTAAETFSSFAAAEGKSYPSATLASAWEHLLFNQFHDILPGSSIREVYVDATETHLKTREIGSYELERSLEHLASRTSTNRLPAGEPLVVYNQLGWSRTELVRVPLAQGDTAAYTVVDAKGAGLPTQSRSVGFKQQELMFVARDVPPFGHASYVLRKTPPVQKSTLRADLLSLSNEFYQVRINPETGWVDSVVDRRTGRNLLAGPGNRLQLLEDKPRAWDAWNIGLTGVEYPTTFRRIELVEKGPVRVVLRLHRTYLKPGTKKSFPTEDFPNSFFMQDIILNDGIDRVDFVTHADWWEEKTMAKVAFPVSVRDSLAAYEVPFGSILRSTRNETSYEKAQFEVPSHRWAALSDSAVGITLLNRAKYGYDIKANVMRLSLLRSPVWPDRLADRGKHEMEYALTVTEGGRKNEQSIRRGYEYNSPLLAVRTGRHAGTLPASGSFMTVSNPDLIVTSVKKSEDTEALIVTAYNATGKNMTATITMPKEVRRANYSDVMEGEGAVARSRERRVEIDVRGRGMVVVRVELK